MAGYNNANLAGYCTRSSKHDICIVAKEIFSLLGFVHSFESNDTEHDDTSSRSHSSSGLRPHVSKTIANQTHRRHGLRRPPRQLRGWHPTHQYRRRRIGRPLLLTALNSNTAYDFTTNGIRLVGRGMRCVGCSCSWLRWLLRARCVGVGSIVPRRFDFRVFDFSAPY